MLKQDSRVRESEVLRTPTTSWHRNGVDLLSPAPTTEPSQSILLWLGEHGKRLVHFLSTSDLRVGRRWQPAPSETRQAVTEHATAAQLAAARDADEEVVAADIRRQVDQLLGLPA